MKPRGNTLYDIFYFILLLYLYLNQYTVGKPADKTHWQTLHLGPLTQSLI